MRRALLACIGALLAIAVRGYAAEPAYAPVLEGVPLAFPRDRGSHGEFRTEWWYVTGSLRSADGAPLGFQITFFRTRPDVDAANPSAFAPRELLAVHAALSDPRRGSLWRDQRIARAALGLAGASSERTDVWIDGWRLREQDNGYAATFGGEDFGFTLQLDRTQAPLLNGNAGFSRKGPAPRSASYYYSEPHLAVRGTVQRAGRTQQVTGEAWLDHEWSSEYLDAPAIGWDWIGINLADGGALMAFRIRGPDGNARWAGGTLRDARGAVRTFAPGELVFQSRRSWRSPRTGTRYPVEWLVTAGDLRLAIQPLMDDQENDARLSVGAVYWEGAVTVRRAEAPAGSPPYGSGYLELTGYGEPLRLP